MRDDADRKLSRRNMFRSAAAAGGMGAILKMTEGRATPQSQGGRAVGQTPAQAPAAGRGQAAAGQMGGRGQGGGGGFGGMS